MFPVKCHSTSLVAIEHSFNRRFLKIISSFQKAAMTCFCVAQLKFRIKGQRTYSYNITVNKELTYTIDDDNKHSSNAIKILFLADEKKKEKDQT